MVTLVRLVHKEKALSPIFVTLSGIFTLVIPQYENAPYPMIVTGFPPKVEGIVTSPHSPWYFFIVAFPL